MVYMFSLSVGFRWSLLGDHLGHEYVYRRVRAAKGIRLEVRTVNGTRAPEGRMYNEQVVRRRDMMWRFKQSNLAGHVAIKIQQRHSLPYYSELEVESNL